MFSRPKKFFLRWRFDYPNKPSVYGMWSQTTNNPIDQAWNKTTGAIRMKIEAKHVDTKQVSVLVDQPAEDFRNFSWMVNARMTVLGKIKSRPMHQLVGLEMWTRDSKIQVYDDGTIAKKPLSEADKKLNLATYGK